MKIGRRNIYLDILSSEMVTQVCHLQLAGTEKLYSFKLFFGISLSLSLSLSNSVDGVGDQKDGKRTIVKPHCNAYGTYQMNIHFQLANPFA